MFKFTTSDLAVYDEQSIVLGSMMIRIVLGNLCSVENQNCANEAARFFESSSCADILDATGGLSILSCTFRRTEARIRLTADLQKKTQYSLTIKMQNPQTHIKVVAKNQKTLNEINSALIDNAWTWDPTFLGTLTKSLAVEEYNIIGCFIHELSHRC